MLFLIKRRDGRVGRRRSPAKRVYWETGIQGSNPCLSATFLSDTALIYAKTVTKSALILFSVVLLNACDEPAEKSRNAPKPRVSHRAVKEKAIVVPPEVTKRWKAVKVAVIDKTRGTESIYVVPIGKKFTIPSSNLSITVEAFLPAFIMEGSSITTSSNELTNPGAKVKIYENNLPVFLGWIFLKFPNTHAVTHPKFGFSLLDVIPFSKK